MRFVILHYHIFKNAGSTLEDILAHSFGHRFARLDSGDRDHTFGNDALADFVKTNPQLAAVSSHQIRHPLPEVPGILFFDICFLRDPVDRVRSMYEYFRQRPAPGDPVSDLARALSPGAFVGKLIEEHPLQVRDVQVNLLARGGDSDEPNARDLEVATERMLEASFPGVVDIFEQSVAAGEYFLRQVFPELDRAVPAANVSDGLKPALERDSAANRVNLHEACEPAVYGELLRLNALDFELLRRVRADIARRNELISGQPPRRYPRLSAETESVRCRKLFDEAFYLAANPDVAAARVDPLKHYMRYGFTEGRKPHPCFQPDFYLAQLSEKLRGGINPLLHYLQTGAANPHRLFDQDAWVAGHPEVETEGLNPLVHHLATTRRGPGGVMIDDLAAGETAPPDEQRRFFGAVNPRQWQIQLQRP